jgi:hypothetical protein
MTELYNRMIQMKKIAVLPNLGNNSLSYATQPTTTMAGSATQDIFFALTYKDVENLKDQAWKYGLIPWWTRTLDNSETVWEVNPSGKLIGGVVTNATGLGAVPGVWVRTE